MTTQVQIRGASQATQEARTLAARELDVNTTDSRIVVHDGSTAGGMKHVNARDAQNQEFTYAAASGTDTITATYAYTPSQQAGQKFGFKAANNCTGPATFNPNSAGAKTIKKTQAGALVDLEPDDIVQNAYYEVADNGTYYILLGSGGAAAQVYTAITAANDASVEMASVFTAGNDYDIELTHVIPSSDAVNFYLQFTDDNGSTYETTGITASYIQLDGTTLTQAAIPNAYLNFGTIGSAGNEMGVSGKLTIRNPAASSYAHFDFVFTITNSSGVVVKFFGGGVYNVTTPLTGFRVKFSGGNVESGTVVCREIPLS